MTSTGHEQVAGTGADQTRDRNHQASFKTTLKSKSLEVARNGVAGATAGGERERACSRPSPLETPAHYEVYSLLLVRRQHFYPTRII